MLIWGICTFFLLIGHALFESSGPPPRTTHYVGIVIYINVIAWLFGMSAIVGAPLWYTGPVAGLMVIGIIWRVGKIKSSSKFRQRR